MSASGDSYKRNPLRKAFQVLNWMAAALPDGVGLREMAQALRMPPSTLYGVLHVLEQEGLVRQDSAAGRYHLSVEAFRLAHQVTARFPMAGAALPIMRSLVDACGETVDLYTYDPARMKMMCVATVESSHPIRLAAEPSQWTAIYAGSSGQSIMAFLTDQERQEIAVRTQLSPFTEHTITDFELLEQELALVRQRGYAFSRGQRIPGAVGINAPIWGTSGRVIGSVGLTIPEQRFDASRVLEFGSLVAGHAAQISGLLGWVPVTIEPSDLPQGAKNGAETRPPLSLPG